MAVSPTGITLSGLLAQGQRLGASAQNTANLRSSGALPGSDAAARPGAAQPYQPVQAQTVSVSGADGSGQGVRTVIRPSSPGFIAEYQPDSANADANGLVASPDVDPAAERLTQISSLRAYQSNLAVLKTQDQMDRSVIDSLA